jgi:hypothetical protein
MLEARKKIETQQSPRGDLLDLLRLVLNELIKPKCFNIRLPGSTPEVIRHLIGELFSGVSSAGKESLNVCVVDMEVYSAAGH